MDYIKESTHKSKKTYSACAKCFATSYSCKRCGGACIFTRPFLNKLRESNSLQAQMTYKTYSDQIENLRESILKNYSQQAGQELVEDASEYTALELLEIFHENHKDYFNITKVHCNEYEIRNQRVNKFAVMCSHNTTIKGRCEWDRPPKSGYGGLKGHSRCRRKQMIMKESEDFILEESKLEKELSTKQLAFLDV